MSISQENFPAFRITVVDMVAQDKLVGSRSHL